MPLGHVGQNPPKVFLGCSLPVGGCRVKPVDPLLKGHLNCRLSGVLVLMNHQAPHITAAENDFGNLNPCLTKCPVLHLVPSSSFYKPYHGRTSPL